MTRSTIILVLATALAACGSSTGPQGKDPTVLMDNQSSIGTITLVWWDQSGQQATFATGPHQSLCAIFTATTLADSVRFMVYVGDTLSTSGDSRWSKNWSPWFDPATGLPTAGPGAYPDGAEYWTATMTDITYPGVVMGAVASAHCS